MHARLLARHDDEIAILSSTLQHAGLRVTTDPDVEHTLANWTIQMADIILIAVYLRDPLPIVQRLASEVVVPLFVIMNHADERTKIALLNAGADRVVFRPYSACLLIAQISAILRRANAIPQAALPVIHQHDILLDPPTQTVRVGDKAPIYLTRLEFRLLYTLMTHRNQVLPREKLIESVWGYNGTGSDSQVRGLVSRVRSKLEKDPSRLQLIQTISGVGYVFRG
jgi:DNA-binding response OmpR family regulator